MRARWTSTGRQRRPARPGETGRGDASGGRATSPGRVGQPVIALMAAHPGERIRITVVPTFVGGHMWRRLAVVVHGMLRATWLELRAWAARLTGVPPVAYARSYDFGGRFDRLPPLIQAVLRRVLVADHWVVWASVMSRSTPTDCNRLPTGSACCATLSGFRTLR